MIVVPLPVFAQILFNILSLCRYRYANSFSCPEA